MDVWDLEDPTPDAVCCQHIDGRWVKALKCLKLVVSLCDSDCRLYTSNSRQTQTKLARAETINLDPNY